MQILFMQPQSKEAIQSVQSTE
uniref:Uncharacterized protein n=1 Tax=Anopheles dirus TaxID=7168 RepID=A0A182NY92_9DIPT